MDPRHQALIDSFKNEQDRDYIREALRIQSEAEKEGFLLRLLGALAFRYQCPVNAHHFEALERRITDIDFAAYSHHRDRLIVFFRKQGYLVDENALVIGGGFRYIFEYPKTKMHIDIFFDQLEMCHTISFNNRLDLDPCTISLSDLLLEKMQIVEISRKDLKDTSLLLLEHPVGRDESTLNMGYITPIMSTDWGFYHTFTTNLGKVREAILDYETLSEAERETILRRIEEILRILEASEKSLKWKLRARVGTKMKWYRDVG
jgi:hypothetical protein